MINNHSFSKKYQVSDTGVLDNNSINYRVIQNGLMMALHFENNPSKKVLISQALSNYQQFRNPVECRILHPQTYQLISKIRKIVRNIKFSFIQLTAKIKQYQKYADPLISETLMDIQSKLDINDFKSSYEAELLNIKNSFGWTTQFVKTWVENAFKIDQKQFQPFKKSPSNNSIPTTHLVQQGLKRSSPINCQTQTQVGQQPVKKIKKDSLNYRSVTQAMKTLINHSKDQKQQQLQNRLQNFESSLNPEYLRIKDQQTCKILFSLRGYMKYFHDSFVELVKCDEYSTFADPEFIDKIFQIQQFINPYHIMESYKKIIQQKKAQYNWPIEMIDMWIQKVQELKRKEVDILSQRAY